MDRSRRVEIVFTKFRGTSNSNDWNQLQLWNSIFNGDLSDGTGGVESNILSQKMKQMILLLKNLTILCQVLTKI